MSDLRTLASKLVIENLKLSDIETKIEEGQQPKTSSDMIKSLAAQLVGQSFKLEAKDDDDMDDDNKKKKKCDDDDDDDMDDDKKGKKKD